MSEENEIRTADLAAEVGVSRQMIARWSREGLEEAAKLGRGKWDREQALSWIADRREDSIIRGYMPSERIEPEITRSDPVGADQFDSERPTAQSLLEARLALYEEQARGAAIRNQAAQGLLVYRERATGKFAEVTAECISAGDAWARDHTTPACASLLEKCSAAAVIALKAELWHEIRRVHAEAVRRVESDLAAGEDVGPTRIRVSGRMGR